MRFMIKYYLKMVHCMDYKNSLKYIIAKYKVEINYEGDEYFTKMLKSYRMNFYDDADLKVDVEFVKSPINLNIITTSQFVGDSRYIYRNLDGEFCVYWKDDQTSDIISHLCFSKDFSKCLITLYDLRLIYNIEALHYVYNMVGFAFSYFVQMNNAICFHSSAIACCDEGIVFSALSGTGKSTHTSLWVNTFKDTTLLNDDSPIIKLEKGRVLLCGTPWAGSTGVNLNRIVPLKAIVFISRAQENTICQIEPKDALQRFFQGVFGFSNDFVLYSNLIDTASKILDKIPVYDLSCNMDTSAALLAHNVIYK